MLPAMSGIVTTLNKKIITGEETDRPDAINNHLYFVSDRKIKDGDYCINNSTDDFPSEVFKWSKDCRLICNKIEATTDTSLPLFKDLTGRGLHTIECGKIPQIHQSFVEVYFKAEGKINEVSIEIIIGQGMKDNKTILGLH